MSNWTSNTIGKREKNKNEKEKRIEIIKKRDIEFDNFDDYSSDESSDLRKSEEVISNIGDVIEDFLINFYIKNFTNECKISKFQNRTCDVMKDLSTCQKFLEDFTKINSTFIKV